MSGVLKVMAMGRLVEVQDAQSCPSPLVIQAGDMVLLHAAGGRVRSGGDTVELVGAFITAVLGDDGRVLTPMGAPNTVLIFARRPGRATVDVVGGDPFHAPETTTLAITVEP